ncbi:MAG: LytTR family transcriptional regulator [Rhodobacteraceae bacterium]|nr:LytTR family transcriptional regulator [Paracoccaceae bacterium]
MGNWVKFEFSRRDQTVLHALPAVLWLSGCLYAVLTQLQALPPGVSSASPVSFKNVAVLGLCFLLTYPVYRMAYLALRRTFPDWQMVKRLAVLSLICVAFGATALVGVYIISDANGVEFQQVNSRWYLLNLFVGMGLMPVFFFFIRGGDMVREQIVHGGRLGAVRTLLQKAGPGTGRRLVRLQSADHYVEVHTEVGTKLLLMRLSDAMEMLIGSNGAQVHRSHWVNLDEVDGVVKRDRKIWLRMSDGIDIPVSRSYRPGLREVGVL